MVNTVSITVISVSRMTAQTVKIKCVVLQPFIPELFHMCE